MRVASFGSCLSRRIIDQLELINSNVEVVSCVMQLKITDFMNNKKSLSKIDLYELAKKSSNSLEVQLNILQQHKDIAGVFRSANNSGLYPFKGVFEGSRQVDLVLIDNFPELVFRSSRDKNKRRVFIPNIAKDSSVALELLDYDPIEGMVNDYNQFLSKLRDSQPNAKIFILNFPVSLSKSSNIKNRGNSFYRKVISRLPLEKLSIINLKMNSPMPHQMSPNYSHFNDLYYNIFAYRILGYFNNERFDDSVRSLSTTENAIFIKGIFPNAETYPVRIDSYIESYIWKSKIKDKKYHIKMGNKKPKYLLLDFELMIQKLNNYQSVSHEGILDDLVSDKELRLNECSFLNLNKCTHYLTIIKEVKVLFNDWQKIDLSDAKVINRIILLERKSYNKGDLYVFSAKFKNVSDFSYAFKEYFSGVQYKIKL